MIRPHDFLEVDALLSDEERAIRDRVRRFAAEQVIPFVGSGSMRRRSHASWRRRSADSG